MNDEINDKVVVITGASSGIGEAIALLLAEKGAKVVLGARRLEQLQKVAKRITDEGGEAIFQVTDVKQLKDLENLVSKAVGTFGRLDVIINNAGISRLSRFDDLQVKDWEEMIDVNLKGVLYGIAASLPVFRRQNSGHIINIISTSGLKIVPLQGVYAATKNAVRTISEALRQEAGDSLRVTGISPGFVKTNLADSIRDPNIKKAIADKAEEIAISPTTIAEAVLYAIGQPANVDVGDIVIRPTAQD
jgi:NADP-dependent 3-hydroxy acid dehydrogenase YdfG